MWYGIARNKTGTRDVERCVKVDIWSDVVCPWCYIGKRRFEAALDRFTHRAEVRVTWRSFELDPNAQPSPDNPGDYAARLARKYGVPLDHARLMIERVVSAAAEEGLDFRFDLARQGNTFDAHRLLHLGSAQGVQNDLKERLDHGTFTEGLAVSDHQALTEVATEVGLDEIQVKEVLTSDMYADAVRADEAQARAYGITAVPFFVIDDKFGVAGAQDPEVMLGALEQAWQARSPLSVLGGGDESCDDGSCAV